MKLISLGIKFEIEDKYIEYSPLLVKILETKIPVEMQDDHIKMDEICDPESLLEYLKFLQGLEFLMNDLIAEAFDLMGHENKMLHPIDTFKMKLQDNWIKDHFYEFDLLNDPYYENQMLGISLEESHKK